MKIMKQAIAVAAVALAVMTGCSGNASKKAETTMSENKETTMEGVKTIETDGMKVTWIQDNTQERLMERTLFADASDAWLKNMSDDKNAMQRKMDKAYAGHMHLFNPGDTLPCGITAIDAAGHTPGHTAYMTGKLLVVGDLMHGAALQIPHPEICAAYDMDKEKAIQTRKQLLEYAKANKLIMAGMHLPAPAFLSFE